MIEKIGVEGDLFEEAGPPPNVSKEPLCIWEPRSLKDEYKIAEFTISWRVRRMHRSELFECCKRLRTSLGTCNDCRKADGEERFHLRSELVLLLH